MAQTTQTNSTPLSSSDWFLVSNKDSLSIKIRHSITLGEDALGLLILNGADHAECWFTLTIDHAGHLEVTRMNDGIHMEAPGKWSTSTDGAILPAGTVIALPNNELYVSQDLQRGKPALKVKVTALVESEDVPILEEIATAIDDTAAADAVDTTDTAARMDATGETAAEDLAPIVVTLPVEEQPPEPSPRLVASIPPIRSAPTQTPVDNDQDHSRVPRWVVVVAPMLVFAAVAAGVYFVTSRVPEAITEPQPRLALDSLDTAALDTASLDTSAAATAASASVADTEPGDRTAAALLIDDPSATTPHPDFDGIDAAVPVVSSTAAASPAATDTSTSVLDVPTELARARRLLDQGYINWPVERNAAYILGTLLTHFPDLDEALTMLDEAAEAMLDQARGAFSDGFQDSAIRVLEEVMIFHPNYAPARELHQEWTLARQVQYIDSATRRDARFENSVDEDG